MSGEGLGLNRPPETARCRARVLRERFRARQQAE